MNYDDKFVLVLGGALARHKGAQVHQELGKYFVKGKITNVVTLGDVND
jgi:hypothetical protein